MKIGIISININTRTLNFGSMIHSYAFQQFLLANGIESTVIDYKPVYFGRYDARHPLDYYRDINPDPDPKKQAAKLAKWEKLYDACESRYDKFMAFADKYYITTEEQYTPALLDKKDPGFDCYIVATDVIWKHHNVSGFDKGYFLASECMKGKKKIAYSASKGAKPYSREQEKQFIEWISDFDYISTRETSLQKYIKEKVDLDVPNVLDPVFLMPREFYEKVAKKPDDAPKGKFILIYLAMQNSADVVRAAVEFARDNGYEAIELSDEIKNENVVPDYPHKVAFDVGVDEWLWYIQNCEYFFTNSFHGCCFSIIFEKRFFVGDRGGDKIDCLLDFFGLQDRRPDNYRVLTHADTLPDIDYAPVRKKKEEGIKFSEGVILGAIHDLEKRDHKPLVKNPEYYIRKVDKEGDKEAKKILPNSFVARALHWGKRKLGRIKKRIIHR